MIWNIADVERAAAAIVSIAAVLAVAALAVLLVERAVTIVADGRRRRIDARYAPLVQRALGDDAEAVRLLESSSRHHRIPIAALLVLPLVEDRDPERIVRSRKLMRDLSLFAVADRYLDSPLWWRRATAVRVLGLLRVQERTGRIIAALDDGHAEVRGAAVDALGDLRNPASLEAIVVRLLDGSLPRGRRLAAVGAFGSAAEPLLLDLAQVAPTYRVCYANALAVCGTSRCRQALCEWTRDPRVAVQAAAFDALAVVGLDEDAGRLAVEALDSADEGVRAAAAAALHGWSDTAAAASLARHLDDAWSVASNAARSLREMGEPGAAELRARLDRADLAGLLARQMLWEPAA